MQIVHNGSTSSRFFPTLKEAMADAVQCEAQDRYSDVSLFMLVPFKHRAAAAGQVEEIPVVPLEPEGDYGSPREVSPISAEQQLGEMYESIATILRDLGESAANRSLTPLEWLVRADLTKVFQSLDKWFKDTGTVVYLPRASECDTPQGLSRREVR